MSSQPVRVRFRMAGVNRRRPGVVAPADFVTLRSAGVKVRSPQRGPSVSGRVAHGGQRAVHVSPRVARAMPWEAAHKAVQVMRRDLVLPVPQLKATECRRKYANNSLKGVFPREKSRGNRRKGLRRRRKVVSQKGKAAVDRRNLMNPPVNVVCTESEVTDDLGNLASTGGIPGFAPRKVFEGQPNPLDARGDPSDRRINPPFT